MFLIELAIAPGVYDTLSWELNEFKADQALFIRPNFQGITKTESSRKDIFFVAKICVKKFAIRFAYYDSKVVVHQRIKSMFCFYIFQWKLSSCVSDDFCQFTSFMVRGFLSKIGWLDHSQRFRFFLSMSTLMRRTNIFREKNPNLKCLTNLKLETALLMANLPATWRTLKQEECGHGRIFSNKFFVTRMLPIAINKNKPLNFYGTFMESQHLKRFNDT